MVVKFVSTVVPVYLNHEIRRDDINKVGMGILEKFDERPFCEHDTRRVPVQ